MSDRLETSIASAMMGSNRVSRVTSAMPASAPPMKKEPTSPMNTRAGLALKRRKPISAPTIAPAKMATFRSELDCAGSAAAMATQISAMVAKSNSEQPASKPSRPSSRLAEFTVPTSTKIITGMYTQPRSHSTLKKGTITLLPIMGCL